MEKFIMAAGTAVRISDSGAPRSGIRNFNPGLPGEDQNEATAPTHKRNGAGEPSDEDGDIFFPDAVDTQSEQGDAHDADVRSCATKEDSEAGSDSQVSDCGGGPVIILLHGYLESLDVWEDFTKLLQPYVRVISVDLPGHGISEVVSDVHSMRFLADTVKGVADSLSIKKIFLAGHSMGGYAALAFLDAYPGMLEGLILMHSTPNPDTEEKKANREREIALVEAGKKELLAPNVSKTFAQENRKKFRNNIEDMVDQVYLTDEDGIAALLRGMMERPDMNVAFKKSSVPELMIFGEKDEYIPVETASHIAGAQPQAEVVWLADSGHMGFMEEPRKTADAVLGFIKSHTS